MKLRWRIILMAFVATFALMSGAGFASSAFAAPIIHNAVTSDATPSANGPAPPTCNSRADGTIWISPSGITYTCRFVQGAGWQWVPKLSCGAVERDVAARPSATC
jgi:hypothetical protein